MDDHGGQDGAVNISDNKLKKLNGKDDDPLHASQEHLFDHQKTYVPGRGIERYKNSLKNLIPFRRKGKDERTMPVDSVGLFSFVSMSWMSKFMYKAYEKELKMEELPVLSPYDTCDYNADRLELLWKKELAKNGPEKASFSRVIWRFTRTRVLVLSLVQIVSIASAILSNTMIMRGLLEYLQSANGSYEDGIKWVLLLTAAESTRVVFWIWSRLLSYRTAVRLRSACTTLAYRKLIRVNNLGSKNIGEVINIFSNDAQRIFDMIALGSMIIEAPISTIFGVFYVLHIFGPMALLGIIAFLLFFIIQSIISRLIRYLQTKRVTIADSRVRLMNEILDCIKLIKMYAWEKRFSNDLLSTRKREQQYLLKTWYCQFMNGSLAPTVPVISVIITCLTHVSGGNNLTAAQVFPYTSFIDSRFRLSLVTFIFGLNSIIAADISINKVKSLLLLEDGDCEISKPILKSHALTISHGTFACNTYDDRKLGNCFKNAKKETISEDRSEEERLNQPTDDHEHLLILFDISFEAEKGKLVGICGHVGSGKSSLLLAALGQLRVSEGRVMRDGSCAYVSQQAWITNATLRENILFGAKFDQTRYQKAIYACNLSQDIGMMPGGDQTEIGEKGINLSGGQKQRVALARALYADRDIYFLDDPLSAVDSRVGAQIFDNLILGALRGKTILFVTHQIQYLNRCDDVYMMRDGKIIEHGTHDELMNMATEYASMITTISNDSEKFLDKKIEVLSQSLTGISHPKENGTGTSSDVSAESAAKSNTQAAAPLIVAENLQQGSIKAHTYHAYIVAAGGYWCLFVVILIFLLNVGSPAFSSWWLATWIQAGGGNTTVVRNNVTIISDNVNDNPHFGYYRTIYGCTIGIILFTSALRGLVFTQTSIGASTKLHNELFEKLIVSPMRFFDTTPSGRIQHLFSKDMEDVDSRLPVAMMGLLQTASRACLVVLIISIVFPWFLLPLCVIAAIYYFLSKFFRVAIRDFKRMENKSQAPVLSFVTATVQGLNTIHAFGKENDFMTRFTKLFDVNSKHLYMCATAGWWLSLRLDTLAAMTTSITAFLIVIFRNQVSPAFAGLALAYANQLSGALPFVMRQFAEAEVLFISVERIHHYIRTLKSEEDRNQATAKPPPTWPEVAEIKFKNVSMAYGVGAPVILKNVSFNVQAGEKIGIVGRTGSGKSSLTVALFRLVELAEGKIEIDDVDISQISLEQLRTKLSIIPQDPVLFSGTIRSNLDPFKLYTDAEIWKALEKTELKDKVQSIAGQLDASVGFGGDNLSDGERQLLCLSRALLRNSKILILDEATAAVDPETEIAVQNTVQREFSNCTILTIAHRLQTVSSLDRVLVIDSGEVLEFDTPSNLLRDKCSEFSKMMAAAKQAENQ